MSQAEEPVAFAVVRGHPTPAELAALTIAFTVLGRRLGDPDPSGRTPSGWSARGRGLRTGLRPGPAAWRMSARG